MNWIKYLLEANLYLVLFYAVYYLLLRRETHYQLNRFYLLATPLLAFAIPKLELGFLKPAPIIIEHITLPMAPVMISYTPIVSTLPQAIPAEPTNYYLLGYIVIAIIMTLMLTVRIFQLIKLARKGKHVIANRVNLIELDDDEHAFSFFRYLFISKKLNASTTIIQHELVHIRQGHSIDIMYMELVKIICWFNPIVYLMQNSIKELHEFIADSKIAATNQDLNYYTDFLINNAYGLPETTITNNFFTKNLLKKRIMMLHQKRSGSLARLKYLVALPLMAGMLCLSTLGFSKDYPVYDILPKIPAKPLKSTAKVQRYQPQNTITQGEPVAPHLTIEDGIDLLKKDATVGSIKLHPAELTKENYQTVSNKIDSLFGPTSPLYIIDGVILTNQNANKQGYNFKKGLPLILSTIPQADILSMEILKDANAAKLYGAKGANGVIIVTTKKGQNKSLFTPGAYPLIYVDGQPFEYKESDLGFDENGKAKSALSLIPQENIAAMHVYNAKDGLATFGPAGADGVIFITTIQGQAKKAEAVKKAAVSNSPLYIIDGVEQNIPSATPGLNTDEIGKSVMSVVPQESILSLEVLKEKQGLSLYGAKGANGVIIVKTNRKPATAVAKKDSSIAGFFNDFYSYVERNVRYPSAARDKSIQGKVFIVFNVNADNTITNVRTLRGLIDETNNEVMRVVKRWTPPAGIPKDANFTLPVSFTLSNDRGENPPAAKIQTTDTELNDYTPNNFKNYVLKETVIMGYGKRAKQ